VPCSGLSLLALSGGVQQANGYTVKFDECQVKLADLLLLEMHFAFCLVHKLCVCGCLLLCHKVSVFLKGKKEKGGVGMRMAFWGLC